MEDIDFQNEVLGRLTTIDARLSLIEEKLEEATGFADSVLSEGGGFLGEDGMGALKETLSAFVTPTAEALSGSDKIDSSSLQELVGSLQDFRSRLVGIKEAISDIPEPPDDSDLIAEE